MAKDENLYVTTTRVLVNVQVKSNDGKTFEYSARTPYGRPEIIVYWSSNSIRDLARVNKFLENNAPVLIRGIARGLGTDKLSIYGAKIFGFKLPK